MGGRGQVARQAGSHLQPTRTATVRIISCHRALLGVPRRDSWPVHVFVEKPAGGLRKPTYGCREVLRRFAPSVPMMEAAQSCILAAIQLLGYQPQKGVKYESLETTCLCAGVTRTAAGGSSSRNRADETAHVLHLRSFLDRPASAMERI